MKANKAYPVVSIILFISLVLMVPIAAEAMLDKESGSEESQNQAPEYPPKRSAKSTWENIVSFPGAILNLPFKLFFGGLGKLSALIYETHAIQKVQDFLVSDDGRRGIMPTSAPQTGFGIHYFENWVLADTAGLGLTITAGALSRQRYQATLNDLPIMGQSLYTNILASYAFLPDEAFFGLGRSSRFEDESGYAIHKSTVQMALTATIKSGFQLNTFLTFEANRIGRGRAKDTPSTNALFVEKTLPGIAEHANFLIVEAVLEYFSGKPAGNPHGGWLARISAGYFHQVNNDNFRFWKLSGDLTKYLHLFYQRIQRWISGKPGKAISIFFRTSEDGRNSKLLGLLRVD